MDLFGIRLLGLDSENLRKVALTIAFIAVVLILRAIIGTAMNRFGEHGPRSGASQRLRFWWTQVLSLLTLALLVIGVASIWFDDPARFATVAGLATAGVAIALQRVITSFAAYLIILRGRVFTVGDRITIGGVRGDVVALGFMQTSVMEMGQPPAVEDSEGPGTWVAARQYTGRLVRVTNDRIFDAPVYNYTREFPFMWEEMQLPIRYEDDRVVVEKILIDAARRHTDPVAAEARTALAKLERRYFLPGSADLEPSIYYRLTDNWLEMTVRFITTVHGVRAIKDAMSRDVLQAMQTAGIGLASATYDIIGLPPVRVELSGDRAPDARAKTSPAH